MCGTGGAGGYHIVALTPRYIKDFYFMDLDMPTKIPTNIFMTHSIAALQNAKRNPTLPP